MLSVLFSQLAAQLAARFQLRVAGGFAADHTLTAESNVGGAAFLLPGAHPFAVAPAVRTEEHDILSGEIYLQEENIGSKTSSSSVSAPMAVQPRATASSFARVAVSTASAVSKATYAPAERSPSATATAIDSVLPVPLQ